MEEDRYVEARIEQLFDKLFVFSQLHNDNGGDASEGVDYPHKPYLSRESYLQAEPGDRRKLYEFALRFDKDLLESIREWEGTAKGFSRIEMRARLILESAHRNLRGRR